VLPGVYYREESMSCKAGDRIRVKATGETGTLISTREYNATGRVNLSLHYARYTKWVRFDKASSDRPIIVGHCASELEVIS
jgi:hypothetical protein